MQSLFPIPSPLNHSKSIQQLVIHMQKIVQNFLGGIIILLKLLVKLSRACTVMLMGCLMNGQCFWKKTAMGFRKYRSVIGYELINEPFSGDIYK